MRIESELALQAARERGKRAGAAAAVSAAVEERAGAHHPRLVGIYGVGRRLFAEVRNGSDALLFLKGHSHPVGYSGGSPLYRLKELAGACVRLEREGEETVLCLQRAGGQ